MKYRRFDYWEGRRLEYCRAVYDLYYRGINTAYLQDSRNFFQGRNT